MRAERLIFSIVGIGASFAALALGFYAWNFNGQWPPSRDPQNWGVFGDYAGGVLNPLLSIMNLAALFYIAFKIHGLETHRELRVESEQRKLESLRLTSEFWSSDFKRHADHIWKRRFEIVPAPGDRPSRPDGPDAASPVGRFYRGTDAKNDLLNSFMIVVAFYQKMSSYAQEGAIDRRICKNQFGDQYGRFFDHFVEHGLGELSAEDKLEGWDGSKEKLERLRDWLLTEPCGEVSRADDGGNAPGATPGRPSS